MGKNITCPKCRFRHPANVTCADSKARAEADRKIIEDYEREHLPAEPIAYVRVMMTGGNAGIAKYVQIVDPCTFNDLPEGTPLYTKEQS